MNLIIVVEHSAIFKEGVKIDRRESISHRLYQTLFGSVSRSIYCINKRLPLPSRIINNLISMLEYGKSMAEVEEAPEFRLVRFGGRQTDSAETQPDKEKELMEKVISSFNAARKMRQMFHRLISQAAAGRMHSIIE